MAIWGGWPVVAPFQYVSHSVVPFAADLDYILAFVFFLSSHRETFQSVACQIGFSSLISTTYEASSTTSILVMIRTPQ